MYVKLNSLIPKCTASHLTPINFNTEMDPLIICNQTKNFNTHFFHFFGELNRSQVVQKNANMDEIDAHKSCIP